VLGGHIKDVEPKGGVVWGVITEGNPPSVPATKAELDAWISSYSTPNTWSLDSVAPQTPMETYFSTGRETYFTIDLATMKILAINYDVTAAYNDLTSRLP